jgi:hypothetical protein
MAVDLTGPALAQSRPARPAAGQELPVRAPALSLVEAEAMLLDRNLAAAARCGVDITRAQRLVADTSPAGSIGYSQTTAPANEGRRFSGYNGGRYVSPLNNASVNLFVTIEDGGKRALRARLAEEQISVAEAQVLYDVHGRSLPCAPPSFRPCRPGPTCSWHWPTAAASRSRRCLARTRPAPPGPLPGSSVVARWRPPSPAFPPTSAAASTHPAPGHDARGHGPGLAEPPGRLLAASRGANAAGADTRLAAAARSRDLALTRWTARRAADAERDTGRRQPGAGGLFLRPGRLGAGRQAVGHRTSTSGRLRNHSFSSSDSGRLDFALDPSTRHCRELS